MYMLVCLCLYLFARLIALAAKNSEASRPELSSGGGRESKMRNGVGAKQVAKCGSWEERSQGGIEGKSNKSETCSRLSPRLLL